MTLSSQTENAVRELCERQGVFLVEVIIRGSTERRIVEVYVDKPDGISLDECGEISEQIAAVFEEHKVFPASYRLDVSSPGVARPLQYPWQYARNKGRLLHIECMNGDVLKGRIADLIAASDERTSHVLVVDAPKASATKAVKKKIDATHNNVHHYPVEIPLNQIKTAVVQIEF